MSKFKDALSLSRRSFKRRITKVVIIKPRPHPCLPTPNVTLENHTPIFLNNSEDDDESDDLNQSFLSDSSDDDSELNDESNMTGFLIDWIFEFDVNRSAVTVLLKYLSTHGHSYLPLDSRTLLATPRSREVIDVDPGKYVHIGLKAGLDFTLSNLKTAPTELCLDINIDGVPVSQSSGSCFWVILCRLSTSPATPPFPIGIYHGRAKPKCFADLLRMFVDEVKEVETSYEYNQKTYEVRIRCFICDAPARAEVCETKHCNGKGGCGRCIQKGKSVLQRMTFPDVDAPGRTNESFRAGIDKDYNLRLTPLLELKMDLVFQFSIDCMHCVYLGVVKKLLKIWCLPSPKHHFPGNLGQTLIALLGRRMIAASNMQPSEFQRKSRSVKELAFFKATELRTFLLFTGPVVLKGILSEQQYAHFLLLHVAMKIFVSKELIAYSRIAKQLMVRFVQEMSVLYGKHTIIYNVHSLIHLGDEYDRFHDLESVSAFDFENFNGKIKKMLHKNNDSLAQISNRIQEIYRWQTNRSKIQMQNPKKIILKEKKMLRNGPTVYKKMFFYGTKFTSDLKNQYFMTNDDRIVIFEHAIIIEGQIKISGIEKPNKTDFYQLPIKSSFLGIYTTDLCCNEPVLWNPENIKCKLFAIEHDNNTIFFPLHKIRPSHGEFCFLPLSSYSTPNKIVALLSVVCRYACILRTTLEDYSIKKIDFLGESPLF
jgi:hypothetical protein